MLESTIYAIICYNMLLYAMVYNHSILYAIIYYDCAEIACISPDFMHLVG